MKNRSGKSDMSTLALWVIGGLLLAYVFNVGGFQDTANGWLGRDSSSSGNSNDLPSDTSLCPSTGTTTVTLNTNDALASTATNVIAEYYVFDGNKLVKSGATASGTASFSVTCGKTYKGIALNTTASSGAYAETFDVNAYSASETINLELVQYGGGKILSIENPADPARNANISIGAGATKQFDIKFVSNVTQKGYNNPIILCQVNVSSITAVSIGSFSDGSQVQTVSTLPKRVTATSGYQYYAWAYPKLLDPSMGVVTASGSITASSSTAPSTADSMDCKLVDQATWKIANYQSASLVDGFKVGAENSETLADVGAPDSSVVALEFTNGGGY